MSPNAILEAIQRHRAYNQGRVEALKRELAATEKEAEELAVAEKVVRRLAAESPQPERQAEAEDEGYEPQQAEPAKNGEPGFSYGH